MINKIILSSIILSFVAGTVASSTLVEARVDVCKGSNNGKPFLEIWTALCDLQSQIDNIQLIPGPQGPAGPQGEVGPAGPQGPPGQDGGGGGVAINCPPPGASLNNLELATVNWEGCNLSNANLEDTNLRYGNLQNTNLNGARLTGADTLGTKFTGCTGTPIGITPNPCA